MTTGDVIETLAQLRFRNGLLTIKLDRHARDYLVHALIARRGRSAA